MTLYRPSHRLPTPSEDSHRQQKHISIISIISIIRIIIMLYGYYINIVLILQYYHYGGLSLVYLNTMPY